MNQTQRKYERGATLIVGLVLLLVATLVVFAGVRGTQMQERMTSNLNNKAISYMAAEAGASAFVDWYFGQFASNNTPGSDSDPPPPTAGNVGGGLGQFTIVLEDPGWTNPGNVAFVSIGESVNAGSVLAESRLRVEVEGPTSGLPPPEAAYQCFGPFCTTATGSNSNSAVYYDGREWDVPENESCSGSGCNGTLTDNPGVPGIYLVGNNSPGAISTGIQTGDSRPGQIQGNPPRSLTDQSESGSGMTAAKWDEIVDKLVAGITPIDPTEVTDIPAEALGSRSEPTVLYIKGESDGGFMYEDIRITGNTHGAGVIVVDGDIDFTTAAGTSTFEGLIILRNGAKLTGGKGTFNVFGSIISLEGQRFTDDALNVDEDVIDADLGGNFTLKYSKSALDNVGGMFGGQETILTWVEQVGS